MSTQPAPITKAVIAGWTGEEMRKQMRNPEKLAEISRVLASPEGAELRQELIASLTEEEKAAEVAQAEAEKVEAERIAAEQAVNPSAEVVPSVEETKVAEAQQVVEIEKNAYQKGLADAKAEVERIAAEKAAQKIVVDYQATDEHGNPIGRPTHLEAYGWEEMSKKQKEAHVQAARAFYRLKNQRTTFKKDTPPQPSYQLTDDEVLQAQEDLKSQDNQKIEAAKMKLQLDASAKSQQRAETESEKLRQQQVSYDFMRSHLTDFYPCEANAQIVKEYIVDNDLEWTVDNLELAFTATELQLAVKPVVDAPAQPVVVNPPVVVPVAAATTEVPAAPVLPVPAVVPAAPPAVNPLVSVPRPGVNTGLIPGRLSSPRITETRPASITKADIKKWTGAEMREKMKNPKIRAEIDRALATK